MSDPQPELRSPEDAFAYDLAAAYDMEVKLVDALEELSRAAANDNLGAGFAIHRTETEGQVRRIEEAFEALGREPTRRDNPIVDGLLAETAQFEAAASDDELRNLHYLTAAIATERVEITSYEGLLRTAKSAGLGGGVTAPLRDNLEQERKTLRKLRGLAGESDLATYWDELTDL